MTPSAPESHYFLSASQETSSRPRLFRPKELREYVFPGVGMIMHSLFWVKHTAYLNAIDADPFHQPNLLLYAQRDDQPMYDEGLLWYCLAARLDDTATVTPTAGIKTVKNWLFAPQYDYDGDIYSRVADELQRIKESGGEYDYAQFVDEVFTSWFVTRCRDRDIDLEDRLKTATTDGTRDPDDEQNWYASVVTGFCECIGMIVRNHDTLRSHANLTVIGSTIRFATQLIIPENEEPMRTLANTRLRFTSDEATALLQAVGGINHGRHFIRSMLFIIYIDSAKQSTSEFRREMRHIYDIVGTKEDAILDAGRKHLDLTRLPPEILSDIQETSFFWLLNFFMADGETITRNLLNTEDSTIRIQRVKDYFDDEREFANEFDGFLAKNKACEEYLPRMLEEISASESPRIHRFLTQLYADIEEGTATEQTLINLLAVNGTVEQETKNTYLIKQYPSNLNAASFYGINPLKNWTETILASYDR